MFYIVLRYYINNILNGFVDRHNAILMQIQDNSNKKIFLSGRFVTTDKEKT